MKTLKQISDSFPGSYKVIDFIVRRGDIKSWKDRIEIQVDGKSKFCIRQNAYKFGLCEGANYND